jgi:two-component system, LytTR family, sensor histidine kinase AlgZ
VHPILSHPHRRRAFLTVWPLVGAAVGLLPFWWSGGELTDWWAVVLWGQVLGVPILASTYVCRAAPLPTSDPARVIATVGLAAAVTSGLWLELGRNWLWLVSTLAPSPHAAFGALALPSALGAALLFGLACAVNYAVLAGDDRQAVIGRALTAEVKAREAELRALRAQVDPHFLFNCLHSISGLIGSNPVAARQMCIDLAAFFRESVKAGRQPRISLATEIDLVRRYLEIERLRFGERLTVTLHMDPRAAAVAVPPLLLQPLVENAVRHGIATLVDGGGITLTVTHEGSRVAVRVDNPRDPDESRPGSGIGLDNVRARLDATYGSLASLRAEALPAAFAVVLSIPLEVTA